MERQHIYTIKFPISGFIPKTKIQFMKKLVVGLSLFFIEDIITLCFCLYKLIH